MSHSAINPTNFPQQQYHLERLVISNYDRERLPLKQVIHLRRGVDVMPEQVSRRAVVPHTSRPDAHQPVVSSHTRA